MAKRGNKAEKRRSGNGVLEFADKLWDAANRARGKVEAAQYQGCEIAGFVALEKGGVRRFHPRPEAVFRGREGL